MQGQSESLKGTVAKPTHSKHGRKCDGKLNYNCLVQNLLKWYILRKKM